MSPTPEGSDSDLEALFADPPSPIPRFNWGAFLIPPIWGVANGQWPGVFFLPLWAFIDNMLRGPQPFGVWSAVMGWSIAGLTLGIQALYAANANRLAWRRVAGHMSPEQYARRQRWWAVIGAVVFAGMVVWITLFILGYGG